MWSFGDGKCNLVGNPIRKSLSTLAHFLDGQQIIETFGVFSRFFYFNFKDSL